MNGANAGTYPPTTGGMTSGRPMPRVFNRSSMGDMSCLLLGLFHDEEESIDIFGRIEQMWCDSDFTLAQGNNEPLVSKCLVQKLSLAEVSGFDLSKTTLYSSLSLSCCQN